MPKAPPTSAPSTSRASRASSRGIAAPVATNVRSASKRLAALGCDPHQVCQERRRRLHEGHAGPLHRVEADLGIPDGLHDLRCAQRSAIHIP